MKDTSPTREINLIPIDGYEKDDLKGLTSEYYLGMVKRNVNEELSLDPMPIEKIMNDLSLSSELYELVQHDPSADGLSITLDWAMQIRQATQYPWALCIQIASIFYYG